MNKIKEIPKDARPIKDSLGDYIDKNGIVYGERIKKEKTCFIKAQTTTHGYSYCGIRYPEGNISKRVHRLVAEAFLEKKEGCNVVGHRNNIKSDNRLDNLYWTTTSENTKKAFKDNLARNDKGAEDSQSIGVNMYRTSDNKLLGTYGSLREAARETGLSLTTISRQAKYKRPVRKNVYFRYADDEDCTLNEVVIAKFDFDTERLLETYPTAAIAAKENNIPKRTVSQQVTINQKPKRKYRDIYFLKITL